MNCINCVSDPGADSEAFRGVQSNPRVEYPLTQNFIFMGNFGYIRDTVFTLNIQTPYSLPYTSLQQDHFTTSEYV